MTRRNQPQKPSSNSPSSSSPWCSGSLQSLLYHSRPNPLRWSFLGLLLSRGAGQAIGSPWQARPLWSCLSRMKHLLLTESETAHSESHWATTFILIVTLLWHSAQSFHEPGSCEPVFRPSCPSKSLDWQENFFHFQQQDGFDQRKEQHKMVGGTIGSDFLQLNSIKHTYYYWSSSFVSVSSNKKLLIPLNQKLQNINRPKIRTWILQII